MQGRLENKIKREKVIENLLKSLFLFVLDLSNNDQNAVYTQPLKNISS